MRRGDRSGGNSNQSFSRLFGTVLLDGARSSWEKQQREMIGRGGLEY